MEISDKLHCLFTGRVIERDGSYVIEVPERELELGNIEAGETYRVALRPSSAESSDDSGGRPDTRQDRERSPGPQEPPVEKGETRDVEIEDIGEQGDGITRVERGFVVIVPDTDQGERVTIEITDVQQNVAFAEVVDRRDHFG